MTRPHLPPEAGGDPSQGPVPELANQPPSPRAGEDFPDAPTGQAPGASDLDQDQLDDFARRLGLTDEPAETGTDEPGTDESATDESATDESATDESATDEPGTDETAKPDIDEHGTDETGPDETGTDETGDDGAADAPADRKQGWRRPTSRGLHVLADGASRASGWLARVSRQIERR